MSFVTVTIDYYLEGEEDDEVGEVEAEDLAGGGGPADNLQRGLQERGVGSLGRGHRHHRGTCSNRQSPAVLSVQGPVTFQVAQTLTPKGAQVFICRHYNTTITQICKF